MSHTNEELAAMIQGGCNVDEHLQELYEQNKGFLHKVIRPYLPFCEKDDLMQEAFLGLWEAAKRYDHERGTFLTYAEHWIRQEVSRYCRSNRSKRIPEYMIKRIRDYKSFLQEYRAAYGEEPTDSRIQMRLDINQKQLDDLRRFIIESDITSIDSLVKENDDLTIEGTLPADVNVEEQVIEAISTERDKKALWEIVEKLGPKKNAVISGYYRYDRTIQQIADAHGLNYGQVCSIKTAALQVLKNKQQIRRIAFRKGYSTFNCYRGNVAAFNRTGVSTVERIAMKRLELDELRQRLLNEITDMKLNYSASEGYGS